MSVALPPVQPQYRLYASDYQNAFLSLHLEDFGLHCHPRPGGRAQWEVGSSNFIQLHYGDNGLNWPFRPVEEWAVALGADGLQASVWTSLVRDVTRDDFTVWLAPRGGHYATVQGLRELARLQGWDFRR